MPLARFLRNLFGQEQKPSGRQQIVPSLVSGEIGTPDEQSETQARIIANQVFWQQQGIPKDMKSQWQRLLASDLQEYPPELLGKIAQITVTEPRGADVRPVFPGQAAIRLSGIGRTFPWKSEQDFPYAPTARLGLREYLAHEMGHIALGQLGYPASVVLREQAAEAFRKAMEKKKKPSSKAFEEMVWNIHRQFPYVQAGWGQHRRGPVLEP